MSSRLGNSAASAVTRGRVKITFARNENGKQLAGSCSVPMEDSTPQEAMAYVTRACDRDAILETISEQSGLSVDDLLGQLQNEHAPAETETATA